MPSEGAPRTMTPFQQFRLWSRRAPRGERAIAAVAAACVLAVLGWVIVPAATSPAGAGLDTGAPGGAGPAAAASTAPAAGAPKGPKAARAAGPGAPGVTAPGAPAAVGPGGSVAATSGSTAGGTTAPGTSSAEGACTSPPGSAPGVTDTQMKVAVMIPDIAGPAANGAFGVPSADSTKKWYQDVIDELNASGGIACRKVVPLYYKVNPADQSDLQRKCLDVAAAGVFVTLDEGGYGPFPQKDCYAQHHIPFFTGYPITGAEAQKFYPYMFSNSTYETIYRNAVFALRDRHFFGGAGFGKLGFAYNSCYPYLIDDFTNWLHQAGVPDSKIVTYDFGCSSTTMPTPSDVQQAVLKFKTAGVTHVTTAEFVGGFWMFTRVAEQQNFRPKYGIADDQIIAISYGSNHPDYKNIDGAIAITPFRNGEEKTPGYRMSAGTARCSAIHTKRGEPNVYQQKAGVGGTACDELWVLKAAVEHAPALSQEALGAGFQAAGSAELSYPAGPGTWGGPRNTAWMNYWRTDRFVGSCNCWRVAESKFHASYP